MVENSLNFGLTTKKSCIFFKRQVIHAHLHLNPADVFFTDIRDGY